MPAHLRRPLRAAVGVCLALLFAPSMAGTAHAAPLPQPIPTERLHEITDDYLFTHSLTEFSAVRERRPHPDLLDWSSDGCSWSPDRPLGHDFTASCHRHDFGYRNYRMQSRFNEDNRLLIDVQFRDDMYTSCDGDTVCRAIANIYYSAVRQFGAHSGSTAEALSRARVQERVEHHLTVRALR